MLTETPYATEVWFRPHPWTTILELEHLIVKKAITATPRVEARDAGHPKGYFPGQITTLRLFNRTREKRLVSLIRITNVVIRRLSDLSGADLAGCGPWYRTWRDAGRVLSFFEDRWLDPGEKITIVQFEYI